MYIPLKEEEVQLTTSVSPEKITDPARRSSFSRRKDGEILFSKDAHNMILDFGGKAMSILSE
jgi:hypothetical protein